LDGEDGEGARLQDALAEVAAANGLGQLRSVYTKLFIGPAKLPAPPWESVYATGGRPLLFQESTLAVRRRLLPPGRLRRRGLPPRDR
ncbi:MAG: molecular chaperone TorD family protein, partial [Gordonibacter pamelaeae]